jgi:1-acyl-sn-glycerol-3-phosphate acyltransferase
VTIASNTSPTALPRPPLTLVPILRGSAATLALTLNTVFWCGLLFLMAPLKFATLWWPLAQRGIDRLSASIAECWIGCNSLWMGRARHWDVRLPPELRRDQWALVTANHQSWVDIFVLQRVLNRRLPLLKFFLKRELIWVPVIGPAWWVLDFPFMRRGSKHRGADKARQQAADLETTRAACAKFRRTPTAVMNFVEGTRLTPAKHKAQASPHPRLLKPKSGALAVTLDAMGGCFQEMLDVTIVYPDGAPSFWRLLCGRAGRVAVRMHARPIPVALQQIDAGRPRDRVAVQRWLDGVWTEKDRLIEAVLEGRA